MSAFNVRLELGGIKRQEFQNGHWQEHSLIYSKKLNAV